MKKLISVVVLASSLIFLTACNASTAAQIGDTKISTQDVQSRIVEILSERAKYDTSSMQLSTGEELNRSEMRFLVVATIFEKIAAKNGIKITQAMKDARKAEIYSSLGGQAQLGNALVSAQLAPSDFDVYIQAVLISEKLQERAIAAGIDQANAGVAIQQLVAEFSKSEKVVINPQFGKWDVSVADLVTFDSAGTAVKPITA
ncbi:MAG: hypothetical protein ACKOCL_03520 [Candidatus Nanopelagicaceae bacterium]